MANTQTQTSPNNKRKTPTVPQVTPNKVTIDDFWSVLFEVDQIIARWSFDTKTTLLQRWNDEHDITSPTEITEDDLNNYLFECRNILLKQQGYKSITHYLSFQQKTVKQEKVQKAHTDPDLTAKTDKDSNLPDAHLEYHHDALC